MLREKGFFKSRIACVYRGDCAEPFECKIVRP